MHVGDKWSVKDIKDINLNSKISACYTGTERMGICNGLLHTQWYRRIPGRF